MISYNNLWKVMKEKGVSQYTLIKKYRISPGQITRLKRNESVSTHTIEMFCKILHCQVSDIMEYIEDDPEENPETKEVDKQCENFCPSSLLCVSAVL